MRKAAFIVSFLAVFACGIALCQEGKSAWAVTPMKVTFVDVGQGDCIWIKTPDDGIKGNGIYEGMNILIDAGPSTKRIFGQLESAKFPYGVTIDWAINTHAHNDHYKGISAILDRYEVKNVMDPGYPATSSDYCGFCWKAFIEPDCNFYLPVAGKPKYGLKSLGEKLPIELDWGREIEAKVLHSESRLVGLDINDTSIVIRMKYGDVGFLFMGDAQGKDRPKGSLNDAKTPKYVEKFLLDQYVTDDKNDIKSTVLKVGHHGSETSSTIPFIEAVDPEAAVIMSGRRSFGGRVLPEESVLERYRERGVKIYRTDRNDEGKSSSEAGGDDHILVQTDGKTYTIRYLREE